MLLFNSWKSSFIRFRTSLIGLAIIFGLSAAILAQQIEPPLPQPGNISGTVTDGDHAVVPGASVTLQGSGSIAPRTVLADETGAFNFTNVEPGGPYYIKITSDGLTPWSSAAITVTPGQFFILSDIAVRFSGGVTSVTVAASSPAEIAAEEVNVEEKQRILGVVPNFYVSYDPSAPPLTTRLKYSLAFKTATDPVTFLGAVGLSAMDQAGDTPNYTQGAKGYGERLGANYTTAFTDVMLGGAVFPSLFHQDPRYFYQGTGTKKSRIFHAISSPFICRGDSGRLEPNISSLGGDFAASGLSEVYFPASNRGASLVVQNTLITTAGRMSNALAQEFLLRRLTNRSQFKD